MIIQDLIQAFMPRALDVAQINNPTYWAPTNSHLRSTKSGELVGPDQAMALPAYFAGMRAISEDYAKIPIKVYRRQDERNRMEVRNHAVAKLLRNPNESMTGFAFREAMQACTIGWGNGYALIDFDENGDPVELLPLHPINVLPRRSEDDGETEYIVTTMGVSEVYDQDIILHIHGLSFNGLYGESVVKVLAESLGLSLAVQTTGATFFKRGAMISGVLKHPGKPSDKTRQNIKESWQAAYGGGANTGGTPFLEEGVTFDKLAIPPEDAQFLQTKEAGEIDVCRALRLPPHKIFNLVRASYSSIEHQSIEYVVDTIMPWVVRWEQEITRKLFKDSEEDMYFAEHELQALLRGDQTARAQFYKEMWMIGSISRNEIRARENLPPVAGGDKLYVPLNMRPVSGGKEESGSGGDPPEQAAPFPLAPPAQLDQEEDEELGTPATAQAISLTRSEMQVFFDRSAERVKDRESKAVARAAKNRDTFDAWAAEFYGDNDAKILEAFGAAVSVVSAAMRRPVDLSAFARRHNTNACTHVCALVREDRVDAIAGFLEADTHELSYAVQDLCWINGD